MAGTLTLQRRTSADRTTVRATGAIVLAGIAVKVVATCKESVVAGFYGRSDAMDAFLAAFLIPNLLINLIAESMNQALIPTLIRVRLHEGFEHARQLLASAMTALCLLLAGVAAFMAVLAPAFFPLVASNFAPSKLTLSVHLFYALLPCVVLGGLASSCTAVLNAANRFAVPAFAPAAVPLAIIAGAFAFHGFAGIWALPAAMLMGMAAHTGWMALSVRSSGYGFQLQWYGWSKPLREIAHQYAPALLASMVASGGLLVDQAMAAMLPAGSVSSLVFAGRFVSVAVSLIAGAISSALAPFLSELAAAGDWPGCRAALHKWVARTAMISVPAAAILIAGSPLLVRLVLQHGAFGPSDTHAVAQVLAMYALQIPFFVVSRVPYRLIVALRRMDLVFYCGAINLVLDIVLNLVLMRRMGVAGIALATSLWTVSTCAFLWLWALRLLGRAERCAASGARP